MAQNQPALGTGGGPERCQGRDALLDALVYHLPPRARPDPRRTDQALHSARETGLAAPPERVAPDLPLAFPGSAAHPQRDSVGGRRNACVSVLHPHRALAPARLRGRLGKYGARAPAPERLGLIFRGFCRALGLKNPCAASTPVTGRCG